MPPPLPSSPSGPAASGPLTKSATKTPTTSRRPGSSASIRRPSVTSGASTRNATPRTTQQGIVVSSQRATKVRGSSDKENVSDTKPVSRSSRRQTSSSIFTREKLPSKDGTAQRNAKEVDGLKDYQLGDCLGKGASGAVYRALNWSTGETVAIKQISLANLQKNELNVIMQEIDLLKNLEHPNIVKYHNFVKSTDSLYIILEYCENGSLHTICKNFGKFPENLVSLYTAQVLQGLLFLHEQGVIHRDIKGANILTTKEGLVKLADFGVATKQQGLSDGSVVGTPYWMAPEVIELSGASTASDIWSLGCTVIELIDGKPPYHKLAPMPALFRIVNDDHPPLPEGCSPLVRSFLKECFQKDPNLRVSAKKLLNHPWIKAGKGGPKRNKDPDEAIKEIQDWNFWLRSSPKERDSNVHGSRRVSTKRPISRGTTKAPKPTYETPPANPPRDVLRAGRHKAQVAKHFASSEDEDKSDVWDDDFEQLTAGIGALSLPEHLKPHDELSLFTSEKLKQFASVDGVTEWEGKVEEWDDHFEGELTVKSPLELAKGDALETVRPFYPARASTSDIKHKPPTTLAPRDTSLDQSRRPSRDSQPRTQILRPAQKPSRAVKQQQQQQQQTPLKLIKKPSPSSLLHKESYREDEEEDYSDLIPEDEAAFRRKLAGFSPNRPFDPKHLRNMSSKLGGSVGRRNRTPSSLVHDAAAMRRTRSSLEIQKYAEDEDDDFADVLFHSDDEAPMHLHSAKQRSPQSASLGSDSTGSERGTLKLSGSSTWEQDDEEEDDDPFAALEEELDAVDLESNVARDKLARLVTHVEGLVSDLKLSQTEDALANIADELFLILSESPDVKSVIVSSHGMLPILEILETCTRSGTILRLLRIVNTVIYDNVEVQENMCFVGGIPIISKFAQKKYSADIRVEAAAFVRMMYQTSTLTLQMFVSCGGLNVLVEFLEEDYDTEAGQELVLVGVNGVWSVFELQGPTPKNDFCRIFSRSSVLYPLSLVLNRVLDKESPDDEVIEGRIVNIFLLFSQAENYVKETVADRMVLKRVLKDLRRMSPAHQVTMLKFIKNLSMLATTLDALQNSNAIEVLTDLLGANMNAPHSREISNQVLNTMFNLCRLSKARQEDAALSGLIPLLQRIVQTDRPLKEFALPILCDMAHSGKVGRKVLWQNKGLAFYVSLLADQYWAVTALDAIFVWLQEETSKVEEHLLATPAFKDAIMQCFNESKGDTFENLLDPLVKILRLTPAVAASLAHRSLFERTAMKLHAKKPLVRLNLLRVIRSICDASEGQGTLLRTYGLLESVEDLAESDPAILVKEMAKDVIKGSKHPMQPPPRQYAGLRRTSSSMSTPPIIVPSAGGSMPPTPVNGERRGSYFELGLELEARHARAGIPASSPYRPVSRGNSSISVTSAASQPQWSNGSAASGLLSSSKSSSRLSVHPRPSLAGANLPSRSGSRLSLAPPGPPAAAGGRRLSTVDQSLSSSSSSNAGGVDVGGPKDLTPTHAPASAGTRSGLAVANAAARRRRQHSAVAELNGKA
ncbi:cytokinesis protein sepH-like [Teratosphaeria destructans]|uniref:non-specific serine/threonine protein kinase n=1 Tax=Teratosphaeria destructans TaxID=418781 RepID=A0A9W7STP1_9PEZI|nr:cytokinesis protein sepH-like [Teratosphaeria destructans]